MKSYTPLFFGKKCGFSLVKKSDMLGTMNFKESKFKNDKKYIWTNHVLQKMRFYRLSESRVKRVIRSPKRIEEGIAMDTVASMQPSGNKKRAEEIWVMWQKENQKGTSSSQATAKIKNQKLGKIIIISAWRYPGITPIGKKIEIPEDVLTDLRNYFI